MTGNEQWDDPTAANSGQSALGGAIGIAGALYWFVIGYMFASGEPALGVVVLALFTAFVVGILYALTQA